jgi:hypothetical protein
MGLVLLRHVMLFRHPQAQLALNRKNQQGSALSYRGGSHSSQTTVTHPVRPPSAGVRVWQQYAHFDPACAATMDVISALVSPENRPSKYHTRLAAGVKVVFRVQAMTSTESNSQAVSSRP